MGIEPFRHIIPSEIMHDSDEPDIWGYINISGSMDLRGGSVLAARVMITKTGHVFTDIMDRVAYMRGMKEPIREAGKLLKENWSKEPFPTQPHWEKIRISGLVLDCKLVEKLCQHDGITQSDPDSRQADILNWYSKKDIPFRLHQLKHFSGEAIFLNSALTSWNAGKNNVWPIKDEDMFILDFPFVSSPFKASVSCVDLNDMLLESLLDNKDPKIKLYDRMMTLSGIYYHIPKPDIPVSEIGLLLEPAMKSRLKKTVFCKEMLYGCYKTAFPDKTQSPIEETWTSEPVSFIPLDMEPSYFHTTYKKFETMEREIAASFKELFDESGNWFDLARNICSFHGISNL